jgi:hypothetical protein
MDVYQPCPCGSGKKLKFCCQAIVSEMQKVSELQHSRQHQAALTLLKAVEKKTQPRDVWSRAWIKTTEAFLLFGMKATAEARQLVDEVLEELPEHPLAVAVKGILAASVDGYPACMRAAYRAFEFSAGSQPHLVSHLATILAQLTASKRHYFAAGQSLALAARLDSENEEAGRNYLEFMGVVEIPYPLRDGYALARLSDDDPLKPQFDKACRLAEQGRFSDAAKGFGLVARQAPQRSALWWNIGICHAAAAEDPLAVEALKAAAANEPDFETAVDCLVLARQLRVVAESDKVQSLTARFEIESVSKLLTAFDGHSRFVRTESPEEPDGESDSPGIAAVYRVLDRDPTLVAGGDLSADSAAHFLGDIVIFDRKEGTPSKALVSALGPAVLAETTSLFGSVAGALARAEGEPIVNGFVRSEYAGLIQDWYFPDDLPRSQRIQLHTLFQRRLVDEVWSNAAQELLGGKTPLEAAGSPELKAALAAAIVDLEIQGEKSGLVVDQDAVRSRLGLPAVAATHAAENSIGPSMSLLGLRHRALSELSDDELAMASAHVLQLGHASLCCTVLAEAVDRPGLHDKIGVTQLCMHLARIYGVRHDVDTALDWVARGKQASKAQRQPLTEQALWEIQELMIRSQRDDDPQIVQVANTLWNYYVPKLPEIRDMIVEVLTEVSVPGPWNASVAPTLASEPLAAAGVGASGLWTPGAENTGQPSKLWLPGQG